MVTRLQRALMQTPWKTLLATLLTALSAAASAAPTAYSINSDSGTGNADSLYRINLDTGIGTRIGPVTLLGSTLLDVEGLAISPDGTLYGVDDATLTLFPLNPDNASAQAANAVFVKGLPATGGNDFGMTFACDGSLYITSVAKQSLYRMDLAGNTTLIGSEGSLGVNISALAAYGENPVKLYGLGNGTKNEGQDIDTPNLYSINPTTGAATLINALGGVDTYTEGGLAFDDAGQLWAITDRRTFDQPSQIMKLNTVTAAASNVHNVNEAGFESLAITVPRGCQDQGNGETATFVVQKHFVDGNDQTPVDLNIQCNTGQPLEQSLTVQPDGPGGSYEVKFVVHSFADGQLDCDVWETEPANYSATYECFSEGNCEATESACSFTGVAIGQNNLCVVRDHPLPVQITVTPEWYYDSADLVFDDSVHVDLLCQNPFDGDGTWATGEMRWSWDFTSGDPAATATVYPAFDGTTICHTETQVDNSAVEALSTCENGLRVLPGDETLGCTLTSTVFFEGIPTLGRTALLLTALLLLFTGMAATRRL
ncbi:MAG: hypothetical protein PVJ33_05850 [Lysobacterales bacterium]|jgi:hypothetical protein